MFYFSEDKAKYPRLLQKPYLFTNKNWYLVNEHHFNMYSTFLQLECL